MKRILEILDNASKEALSWTANDGGLTWAGSDYLGFCSQLKTLLLEEGLNKLFEEVNDLLEWDFEQKIEGNPGLESWEVSLLCKLQEAL